MSAGTRCCARWVMMCKRVALVKVTGKKEEKEEEEDKDEDPILSRFLLASEVGCHGAPLLSI